MDWVIEIVGPKSEEFLSRARIEGGYVHKGHVHYPWLVDLVWLTFNNDIIEVEELLGIIYSTFDYELSIEQKQRLILKDLGRAVKRVLSIGKGNFQRVK